MLTYTEADGGFTSVVQDLGVSQGPLLSLLLPYPVSEGREIDLCVGLRSRLGRTDGHGMVLDRAERSMGFVAVHSSSVRTRIQLRRAHDYPNSSICGIIYAPHTSRVYASYTANTS